jgi:hypothetical protein
MGSARTLLSPILRSYKNFVSVFKLPTLEASLIACREAWSEVEEKLCALVALSRVLRSCLLCAYLYTPRREGTA